MLVGINTNAKYQGEIYHIQTEDGGINNPVIVTQIFKEGAIISSCKRDYNDIIGLEDPAKTVKERMQEQHKRLLKDLYAGKFDNKKSEVRIDYKSGEKKEARKDNRISLDDVILNYLAKVEEEDSLNDHKGIRE